jgi:hypothetical protein
MLLLEDGVLFFDFLGSLALHQVSTYHPHQLRRLLYRLTALRALFECL